MIKHIILFRLKGYDSSEKIALLKQMENRFQNLKAGIEEIQFLEVGMNFNTRPVAYDICLYTHFESKEKLDAYQIHPVHKELLSFLEGINREVVVVDYEV